MFSWFTGNEFFIDVMLIRLILVVSVFVAFQAGLFSLASVGFMAIGAYASAILVTKVHLPMLSAVVLAVLVAAVIGLVISPVLRLRGISLALATLAFSEVVVVLIGGISFFGGQLGIDVFTVTVGTPLIVICLALVLVLVQAIHSSHYRRALWAMRLDESTAAGLGVGVRSTSIVAFILSAAIGGLAGALDGFHSGLVVPTNYDFDLIVLALTYVMVGGFGHWSGAVLAAIAGESLKEALNTTGGVWTNFIYGCVLVVVMFVMPNGVSNPAVWRRFRRYFDKRTQAEIVPESTRGAEALIDLNNGTDWR